MLFDATKPSSKKPTKNQPITKKYAISRHARYSTLYTGQFPLFAEFDPFFTKRYSLNATILTRITTYVVFLLGIYARQAK